MQPLIQKKAPNCFGAWVLAMVNAAYLHWQEPQPLSAEQVHLPSVQQWLAGHLQTPFTQQLPPSPLQAALAQQLPAKAGLSPYPCKNKNAATSMIRINLIIGLSFPQSFLN